MGMNGDTALIQAKRYVDKTLKGQGALKGQDGFSPTVKENPSNTDNDYRLDITDKNGTFTTPNLKADNNYIAETYATKVQVSEINSNLTSEISRAKETEEVLKSRIDTITSLPEGSTTGDAELQDIRVKADGTTATSAGNSVREQFSELKSDLDDLKVDKRLSENGTITQNSFVRWTNGIASEANGINVIECKVYGNEILIYKNNQTVGASIGLAFYDENSVFISGVSSYDVIGEQNVTVPINARLVKASIFNDKELIISTNAVKIENAILENKNRLEQIPLFYPKNYSLYNLEFSNNNSYYDIETRQFSEFEGISRTDYIDVSEYKYLKFCGSSFANACAIAFFDEEYNYISSYPSVGGKQSYYDLEIKIPLNCKYCIINDVGKYSTQKPRLLVTNIFGTLDYKNKKWCVFGDSLTEKAPNGVTYMDYHDYIKSLTGIEISYFGVSGTGYKNYPGLTFRERALTIPTDADVITIFGSGNDMGKGYTLGDITDTGSDTLCGCINETINNIYSVNPTIKIGLVTPTPWENYPPTSQNNEMELYSNALVNICKIRGIPCLDLYHSSGLRPWDTTFKNIAFDNIGVHPNAIGHKYIASHMLEFLKSLLLE